LRTDLALHAIVADELQVKMKEERMMMMMVRETHDEY